MQAHFTTTIASVTYLLKMQSRAPSPSHLQADRLSWSSVLCWVRASCCVKAVVGEGRDHAGVHGNMRLLEVSPECYNIL